MHKITKTLGIIAILVLLTGVAQAGDWPMFHHDPAHTGYTDESIPDDLELLWSYETGSSIGSSLAVANGKVFVGSYDHNIYCLNENNGGLIWSYEAGGCVGSSPAVADGKVFVGSNYLDRKIYCLNEATGKLIWSYKTGHSVSSPTVTNGKVFFGSYDRKIYCLDEDTGNLIWSYETGNYVSSSPAVADGKVFVGSIHGNKLYCLDEDTGNLIWSYETGSSVYSSPAVADGKVFVGSDDYKLYCLDEDTGNLIWSYETGSWVRSSPAVADGKVFVGSSSPDNKIYCIDENTGKLVWSYETGSGIVFSSPAVADGKVFVGSNDNKIYCLHEDTGELIWSYETGSFVHSSPAVANGKVFVGSNDNNIYCFGAKSTPTPTAAPNSPPNTPSRPSGFSSGDTGTTYTYSTSATDPDGDKVQYRFDWDDGTVSSWSSLVYSENSASKSYSWSSAGTYYVKVQAKDAHGATSSWSSTKTVTISKPPTPPPITPPNRPPNTPGRPSGSSSGYAGISIPYTYSTATTDPNGDRVQYRFDWDDGTVSSWTSLVTSGASASESHSWSSPGTYYVKAQAKDTQGATSSWSSAKTVSISTPPTPMGGTRIPPPETPPLTPEETPTPTPTLSLFASIPPLYVIGAAAVIVIILIAGIGISRKRKKGKSAELPAEPPKPETEPAKQKPIIKKETPPPISEPVTIERAIYDPCKRDFIEGRLPRMKEWTNRYDPSAYWFTISIQNNTDKTIEEWGVDLEFSSALKIEEAKIEGIEIEIPHEAHLNTFKISVPKEYGIVIPKGGAQRVYFKLRAEKPKTTYEISGVFKSATSGDVLIRTKEFKYLCDAGVSPEAVKVELKKTFSEKDAARLANTFRIAQEIRSTYCSTDTTAKDINKEFDLLKMYFTEKEFWSEIESIQRRITAELREDERLDDKHVKEVKDFCEKFTEMWIAKFLR